MSSLRLLFPKQPEEYNILYVACSRVSTGTLFVAESTMRALEQGPRGRKRCCLEAGFDYDGLLPEEVFGYFPEDLEGSCEDFEDSPEDFDHSPEDFDEDFNEADSAGEAEESEDGCEDGCVED